MKTNKRVQSLVLSAICLCVWCVAAMLPCTAVSAADFNGYEQNFDSLTTLDEAEGWSTDSTLPTVTDETNHGKVIQVTDSTMAKLNLDRDGLTGRYEVKFSIKPESTGELYVDFGIIASGIKSNNTLWHSLNNELHITAGSTHESSTYAGRYEINQWYNVTAMIDTEVQYYSVKVEDESGQQVAYRNGLPFKAKGGKPEYLRFRTTDISADSYRIDNVSVQATTKAMDTVFMQDNFDNYTAFDESAKKNGWVEKNTLTLQSDKSDNGNKYMRVANSGGLAIDWGSRAGDPTPYRTGKLQLSASMRFTEPGRGFLDFVSWANANFWGASALIDMENNNFYVLDPPWTTTPANQVCAGSYDTWYDVVLTLDLDTTKYDVSVYYNNNLIGTKKNVQSALKVANSNDPLRELHYITFRNYGNALDVDNVKLEYVNANSDPEPDPKPDPDPEPENYILCDENFSSMTAETIGNYGWTLTKNSNDDYKDIYFAVNPEKMPGSLELGGNTAQATKTLSGVTGGKKYRFTYTVYHPDRRRFLVQALPPGSNNGVALISVDDAGKLYYTGNPWTPNKDYLLTEETLGEGWYTFENVYDLAKKTMEYTVKDAEGRVIVDHFKTSDLCYATTPSNKITSPSFDRFTIADMQNGTAEIYLGGLKVEDYEPVPEITAKSITLIDGANNEISDLTEPVSRVIRKVVLNFNCALDETTLGGITLTNAGTNASVDFTAQVSDGKYIMTLSVPVLDSEATYRIYIPDTVSNLRGQKIDSSKRVEFKTNNLTSSMRLNGVKQGDTDITDVSKLQAGGQITVDTTAISLGDNNISLTWIAAYYSGGRMVYNTVSEPMTVNNENSGVKQTAFTVPEQAILDKVDLLSIYLWDGINSLVPYCKALNITK